MMNQPKTIDNTVDAVYKATCRWLEKQNPDERLEYLWNLRPYIEQKGSPFKRIHYENMVDEYAPDGQRNALLGLGL